MWPSLGRTPGPTHPIPKCLPSTAWVIVHCECHIAGPAALRPIYGSDAMGRCFTVCNASVHCRDITHPFMLASSSHLRHSPDTWHSITHAKKQCSRPHGEAPFQMKELETARRIAKAEEAPQHCVGAGGAAEHAHTNCHRMAGGQLGAVESRCNGNDWHPERGGGGADPRASLGFDPPTSPQPCGTIHMGTCL